jgi:hypothetical protein
MYHQVKHKIRVFALFRDVVTLLMLNVNSQCVAITCEFKEFEAVGFETMHVMEHRFSDDKLRGVQPRYKFDANRTWLPADLCGTTQNLFSIVYGLTHKAPSFRHKMIHHLPKLMLIHNRSSGLNLGQMVFHTFTDLLDFPGLHPSRNSDVCPAPAHEARGTILWWLSARDSKAPLLIKLALAAMDAEGTGWTLKVVYSDESASVAKSIWKSFPPRCQRKGFAITLLPLSTLGVPQPPGRGDLSCFQFSRAYYELSSTEHVIVAGGDDVVVRRPLLDSEYTYALMGAPWIWCRTKGYPEWCKYGGNGGFSYRSKSFALKYGIKVDPKLNFEAWKAVCAEMKHLDDSMWARSLIDEIYSKKGSLWRWAGPEIQARFSVETVRHSFSDPCAMHKTWKYLDYGMDSTYISKLLVAPAYALGATGYY